jgi:hypothetical protein
MATITSFSFAKALWPGVKAFIGQDYKAYTPEYPEIYTKDTSDKAYEEFVMTSGFGLAARKVEGGNIIYDTARQLFTARATHVTYGIGFIITREMYEDDQYGVISKRKSKSLTFSIRQTKDVVGANLVNNGWTATAPYLQADGVALFSAAHLGDGITWSNMPTVACDISEAALEQASIDIMNFKDARGLSCNFKPVKVIIPPALWADTARILKSTQQPGGVNNDINAIQNAGTFPEGYKINHFFTDSDAWVVKTDCPDSPLYLERRPDEFSPAGENDFDSENARFKATSRYSFIVPDPRALYGSAGA